MKTAEITKKITILKSAIDKTKELMATIINNTTIEEADAMGLSDFMVELNSKIMDMRWELMGHKEKLNKDESAMKAQQLCAESFYAQAERDNKKHVNTPGAPVVVAHNPEVLILSGLNLDNNAAEIALQAVEEKETIRIIHLGQNNLTALPGSISLFKNVEMVNIDDNEIREVFPCVRNCSKTLKTISASGSRCHRDEFDCSLIGVTLGF